jgi:hypothetical protein
MANRLRLALFAVTIATTAAADGERTPMFGGGIIGSHSSETDVSGFSGEIAIWYGPIGIAAEASRQWSVDDVHGPQVGAVGGSLRLLAFEQNVPSILDSREVVALGIELHGVIERAWWNSAPARDPISYGTGLALRLRGSNDDHHSNMLAESRVFVRVMKPRAEAEMDFAARGMGGGTSSGLTVMIGLGASFGGGQPAYVQNLRRNETLDSEWLVR